MRANRIRIHIVLLIVSFLTACASGSSIVTGTTRSPIDLSQVQLYADAPDQYETIGIVKASSEAGWTQQGSQDYAIEELKKQAAKLGANGVLLTTTGESTTTSVQTVTGKAIYVGE